MNIEELVTIRPMVETDQNFVSQSWLKSLRSSSAYFHSIPEKIYYDTHRASIIKNFENSNCLIAHPNGEPTLIVGYLVYEERDSPHYVILHYSYVKRSFRKMGLASLLIDFVSTDRSLIATHYTDKIKNLTFNPYMFKTERL